ncbi:MAG: anaerobic glycerol-3-phosphate dehydrogenase subunit C, partial [Planctomycetota bacterium]|nr:anaerobic glycerol-3-phosphate dehydrogenase subunit C [Planctomycetota bacterium]
HQVPLHARGAGSGLAGESLGRGLVIDFSQHMRRILSLEDDIVRVQPGTTLASLNRWLALQGRVFGPDPANRAVTTVGGTVSVDGAGSRWLAYGSVHNRVESLQVVFAEGHQEEVHRHSILPEHSDTQSPHTGRLAKQVGALLEREASHLEICQPQSLVNRAGYAVHGILDQHCVDMRRLLVGSEGTLGLITEVSLKTDPLPRHEGVVLLFFERLESAARAAVEIPRLGATAVDLMDRRLLSLARETNESYSSMLPASAEALLLIEFHDEDAHQLRQRLQNVVHLICKRKRLAFDSRISLNAAERALFWSLTEHVVPSLYRLKGSTRPLPFVEDVAVPPAKLPDVLVQIQNVLKRLQITASFFAHAGHGQLHIRPFLDLANPDDVTRMGELAESLYEEVLSVGGTISGEHADGFSRSWYLRRQYGPLYDLFGQIKQTLDPLGILNPGRIAGPGIPFLTDNLRPLGETLLTSDRSTLLNTNGPKNLAAPTGSIDEPAPVDLPAATVMGPLPSPRDTVQLQLWWNSHEIADVARECNGCARCRSTSAEERMCPVFRAVPSEEATPRAKANLLRAILNESLPTNTLESDIFKGVADLCFHCHQCRLECPARVDIPKLMVEAKAQYLAVKGPRPFEWFFSDLDRVARVSSWFRPFVNFALENAQFRWVLEKVLGITQRRKLPRVDGRSFLRRAERRRLTRPHREPGPKVLYFVDIFANWYDVQLADALVRVMEHNGISVYVHPSQRRAGMELIALGLIDRVRPLAARNISVLADAVRKGYEIVTSEPSAALVLRHEYPQLIDDPDAELVARNTTDACAYLWRLHQAGKLELNFSPLNLRIGYHQPCHLRALDVGSPGESLMRLIPGLQVERIERGCSGMAGTFGLKRENYRASLRIGRGLLSAVRDPSLHAGATECTTCRMQMEHGTAKPTLHPLKVLALAYGLMPEIQRTLRMSHGERRSS